MSRPPFDGTAENSHSNPYDTMEKVAFDDVEPTTWDPDERSHDRRPLSDPLGTEHVAVNHYVLEPGDRFSGSMHAHGDQEEVFVVLEGSATFETREGTVTVGESEAVRFGPGEFQTGKNDSDERVVALALGAPRETEDVRIAKIPGIGDVTCPDCGHDHMRIAGEGSGLVCPDCGTAWDPT